MNKLFLTFLFLTFLSCSNNKKETASVSDVPKINGNVESENLTEPTPCKFPETLTIDKLKFAWKNLKTKDKEIEYYFFDSNYLKICLLDNSLKNKVSIDVSEYSLENSDKIVLHKNIKEDIEVYLTHNYSLMFRNKTKNTLDTFIKIDPNSKEFQEVKSICNF